MLGAREQSMEWEVQTEEMQKSFTHHVNALQRINNLFPVTISNYLSDLHQFTVRREHFRQEIQEDYALTRQFVASSLLIRYRTSPNNVVTETRYHI